LVLNRIIIGELRVQQLAHADGRKSFTIVWPDESIHQEADEFLRLHSGSGTQKTYAYYLVDHLRWRQREGLRAEDVSLRDLHRYMGAVGAKIPMPYGQPWRTPPQKPYGQSALSVLAACLKGFYAHWGALGVNLALASQLDVRRLPTKADRDRSMLGHTMTSVPSNPLAPRLGTRRPHPKMLPDGARSRLEEVLNTARDRMVVTWLADAGPRIGELVGLHLVDLHLRENAQCGECRPAHFHVCHRGGNPNGAAAKTKATWSVRDGVVTGGLIKRVSPAMIGTYFDYMTTEYPKAGAEHGMLLVQLAGLNVGQPWSADAARGMLRRAGRRAGLPTRTRPHAFRHSFTNAVLDATDGNVVAAQVAGGWASARTVDETYSHPDLHNPGFQAALVAVWEGER
jgi:integrase